MAYKFEAAVVPVSRTEVPKILVLGTMSESLALFKAICDCMPFYNSFPSAPSANTLGLLSLRSELN